MKWQGRERSGLSGARLCDPLGRAPDARLPLMPRRSAFPLLILVLALFGLLAGCGSDDEPVAVTTAPQADPVAFKEVLNADLDDIIREMTVRIDALIVEGRENPIDDAEVRGRTRRIAADAARDLSERFDLAAQEATVFAGQVDFPAEREFLEGRTFFAVYSQQIRVEDALKVPLGLEDPLAD